MGRRKITLILASLAVVAATIIGGSSAQASPHHHPNTNPKKGWVKVFPDDDYNGSGTVERCDPYNPGVLIIRNVNGYATTMAAVNDVLSCK